jgi:hypothetical protein
MWFLRFNGKSYWTLFWIMMFNGGGIIQDVGTNIWRRKTQVGRQTNIDLISSIFSNESKKLSPSPYFLSSFIKRFDRQNTFWKFCTTYKYFTTSLYVTGFLKNGAGIQDGVDFSFEYVISCKVISNQKMAENFKMALG